MKKQNTSITINSRKFDGHIHRSWQAEFIEHNDSLLNFVGKFERGVSHPHLGVIRRGTVSYEFYWFDRWYNIFRFHEPEGELRNFYCNVNLPPTFDGEVLDYVDLDIDVVVWKDFSYQILDLEEFEKNAVKFSYPQEIYNRANESLKDILSLIKRRDFPFDNF